MALLEIANLTVDFATATGSLRAVDGIDLEIDEGEIVAIVGESGSGKSVGMLALMGLLPWTSTVSADRMFFDGQDLLRMNNHERRKIIGKDISMIFQEPMTSLNPCLTVGYQITEVLCHHFGGKRRNYNDRAIELLKQVGIAAAESRLNSYPHQLSGGMCQRVMIAMMIACQPKLLIADEPTTALDVTIQAQILDLLIELQKIHRMALILITHDMSVVAETAERVVVLYAGQQVEQQNVRELFNKPRHPYSEALLNALPERAQGNLLNAIPGVVPGQTDRPQGCLFSPRCSYVKEICIQESPIAKDGILCHFPLKPSKSNKSIAIDMGSQ